MGLSKVLRIRFLTTQTSEQENVNDFFPVLVGELLRNENLFHLNKRMKKFNL